MDIYRAFKLVIRYFWLLAIVPVIFGSLMFLITKSESKEYFSKATIYTGLTSGYSIESQANQKVDYFATTAAFDNMVNILKSKNVLETAGLKLFTQNIMLEAPEARFISAASFNDLQSITPEEVKALVVKGNFEATYQRLLAYKNQSEDNFLYELINLKHPHYSVEALSKVGAKRIQGSDLFEISYKANDPGITYQTLVILIDVFFQTHSALKMTQTSTVVEYFEKQLAAAWERLVAEENKLLEFNKANKIINYHEQTKYVASQKEQFELSFQRAQMDLASAQAAIERIEADMSLRHNLNLNTRQIGNLRSELLNLNRQIERLEFFEKDEAMLESRSALLLQKADIETKIRQSVDSLFNLERNIDGVERDYILTQWFINAIQMESAAARIDVLNSKRVEFDELYMFFAPLGATINRIERAIGVLEREYLSILHNLGLAKLKQQNLELSATMDILDQPYFPILVQPSKRKIFVAAVAMFSFLFVLAGLFVTELIDRRLKTVRRVEKITGLKVAGTVVCEKKKLNIDIPILAERAINDLIEQMLLCDINAEKQRPHVIQVFSHWGREGKSFVIRKLKEKFESLGYVVSIINIDVGGKDANQQDDALTLSEQFFHSTRSIAQWKQDTDIRNYLKCDFLLIEAPALSSFRINYPICKESTINLLLANASRTWSSADDHYLEKLKSATEGNLKVVINCITADNIEEYIGDIPKKRSSLRKLIKNRIFKRYIGFYS